MSAEFPEELTPPYDYWNDALDRREEGTPPRILVVDDEQELCEVLREILSQEGYVVETAADGEETLALMQQRAYDLVLSDLQMPKMDGLELLRRIKEFPSPPDVIIITGHASVESAVRAMKLGAVDYIPKPLNFDLLRLVVAKTLERQRLKRRAAEVEFYKRLSRIDGLTEVYNHRFFHQVLSAELARAQRFQRPLSLLMIDVDHFKEYNDLCGHQAGDAALQKLAWLFKRFSRSYDFVARYGGEEFAIILPETGKETAILVGERIRQEVLASYFPGEERLPQRHLSISLGLATYPSDATVKEILIKVADEALYKAKKLGRNRLCYFPTRPPSDR
ncbi:MAG: diguanylate cyclase [Nitrospinota bacterium]|nr:MAG: diguanylate cyclase [Nitrospinota bacterium]